LNKQNLVKNIKFFAFFSDGKVALCDPEKRDPLNIWKIDLDSSKIESISDFLSTFVNNETSFHTFIAMRSSLPNKNDQYTFNINLFSFSIGKDKKISIKSKNSGPFFYFSRKIYQKISQKSKFDDNNDNSNNSDEDDAKNTSLQQKDERKPLKISFVLGKENISFPGCKNLCGIILLSAAMGSLFTTYEIAVDFSEPKILSCQKMFLFFFHSYS